MARAMQVFAVDQADQLRVFARIVEIELDQPFDRERGREMVEIERSLAAAQALVNSFQSRQVETVLVAEIMVDHALVGAGAARNRIDASAEQTLGGELLLGCREDGCARAIRITSVEACALGHAQSVEGCRRRRLTRYGAALIVAVTRQLPRKFGARRAEAAAVILGGLDETRVQA